MKNIYKHLLTGLMFVTGIIGFFEGEYIISSALFAATTFTSAMNSNGKNV